MRDHRISGICQAKKGMLFLRDCGATAEDTCHKCGRPVCANHRVMVDNQAICPECFTQDDQTGEKSTGPSSVFGAANRYRTRHRYYSRFHYRPLYYGRSHYYSDRDYRTFEEEGQEGENAAWEEAVTGAEAEDSSGYEDLDDFMES